MLTRVGQEFTSEAETVDHHSPLNFGIVICEKLVGQHAANRAAQRAAVEAIQLIAGLLKVTVGIKAFLSVD